jgi:LysR family nitrogen assimilation transcriptional regulator
MDLKQIKYFLEVAEAYSFSRASARIHITQPALSRQIQQLEHELGVPLLVRHGRGVQLTESGMLFRDRAAAIVREMEQLRDEIRDRSGVLAGEVILGIPPTLSAILTAPVVERFTQAYPQVFLRVAVGISEMIRDKVVSGEYDIGVILASEQTGPLLSEPLLTEPMYLVGRANAWPAAGGPVDAEAVGQVPLLLTSAPNGIRSLIEDYMHAAKQRLTVRAEMNSVSLTINAIARGAGFTVLPRCALAELRRDYGIRAEPIEDLSVSWLIATSKERYQSNAAIRLKAMLHEAATTSAATAV